MRQPKGAHVPSFASLIPLLLGAALCTMLLSLAQAKDRVLTVVTTVPDLAAVAKAVGGAHVEATSVGKGNQNAHFIDAKPSFMLLAKKADLWIRIGLELEVGYEPLILQGARNKEILVGQPHHLDASVGIKPLEIPSGSGLKEASGLQMGDVHPLGNPHYWLDPFDIRVVATSIANKLKEIDPPHAADFDAGLKAFIAQVDDSTFGKELANAADGDKLWEMETSGKLDEYLASHPEPKLGGWFAAMRPLKGAKIVTYHKSWTYFADRFGLQVVDQLEPKPGIPPSPGHVAELIEKMKSENAKIILMEPFYERKAPDEVASRTGAVVAVVALSVGGQPEAKDYISLIDNCVARLTAAARQAGLLSQSAGQ